MIQRADTIFALSTAAGRAALSVVRMSGAHAVPVAARLCGNAMPPPRMLSVRRIIDPALANQVDALIDEGMVVRFNAPNSYTGEDMVEFHLHGGSAVAARLLACLAAQPECRQAEAGEFTRRAFVNGKIDLLKAEAIADLIDAQTSRQAMQAARHASGGLSAAARRWCEQLTRLLAVAEAHVDFSDESDVDEHSPPAIVAQARAILGEIRQGLAGAQFGERIRGGISVVILGAPNAGKSTLLNALVRREVAIVSPMAGTTRDSIEVAIDMDGLPLTLTDTAGMRGGDTAAGDMQGNDAIEREGIRRALERARQADILLHLRPCGGSGGVQPATSADEVNSLLAGMSGRAIQVRSKCDLLECAASTEINRHHREPASSEIASSPHAHEDGMKVCHAPIFVSALTGAGLDDLRHHLLTVANELVSARSCIALTSRRRHFDELSSAASFLEEAMDCATLDLQCEALRLALRCLARLSGEVDVEDLLDIIFSEFCIGK